MTAQHDIRLEDALLRYFREEFDAPDLVYEESLTSLSGGFDTRIFAFKLLNCPDALAGPCILRLFGAHHDPSRVILETSVQDALVVAAYPAPRVLISCDDPAPLGGAFIIMERLPGAALPDVRPFGMGNVLADLQSRLHSIDTAPFLAMLTPAVRDSLTLEHRLRSYRTRIDALDDGSTFEPVYAWLLANAAAPSPSPVVCHGDFHPMNIVVQDDQFGVVDWPLALIADAEFDVGGTLALLRLAPIPEDTPAVIRIFAPVARRLLATRYLRAYRRQRSLDTAKLPYYEALRCFSALLWAAESSGSAATRNPWAPPSTRDAVSRRIQQLTGITLAHPPE
jgi:aminoglycoside phosphotransferase (APT) family kinase protein